MLNYNRFYVNCYLKATCNILFIMKKWTNNCEYLTFMYQSHDYKHPKINYYDPLFVCKEKSTKHQIITFTVLSNYLHLKSFTQ